MKYSIWMPGLFCAVIAPGVMLQPAQAISLLLEPNASTVQLGQPIVLDLKIEGLGNQLAPALSAFEIDIDFNPSVLSFDTVSFGDPLLGDQLDLSGLGLALTTSTLGTGSVNLVEVSLDLPVDLIATQPESFVLAQLTFDAIASGNSSFALTVQDLVAADGGSPLVATSLVGSSVDVETIPTPSLLFATLGFGFSAFRKRRARSLN